MEGMKRLSLIGIVFVCMLVTGCGMEIAKSRPEILLDGVSIEVGKTIPETLEEDGYRAEMQGIGGNSLPGETWSPSVYLKKEDMTVAGLTLANTSQYSRTASQCKIEEIRFFGLEKEYWDCTLTIDGVNPCEMTEEEILEAFPDLEREEDKEENVVIYSQVKGKYTLSFEYTDTILTRVEVQHDFGKSYLPK